MKNKSNIITCIYRNERNKFDWLSHKFFDSDTSNFIPLLDNENNFIKSIPLYDRMLEIFLTDSDKLFLKDF